MEIPFIERKAFITIRWFPFGVNRVGVIEGIPVTLACTHPTFLIWEPQARPIRRPAWSKTSPAAWRALFNPPVAILEGSVQEGMAEVPLC